jgi:hypothetical protein
VVPERYPSKENICDSSTCLIAWLEYRDIISQEDIYVSSSTNPDLWFIFSKFNKIFIKLIILAFLSFTKNTAENHFYDRVFRILKGVSFESERDNLRLVNISFH